MSVIERKEKVNILLVDDRPDKLMALESIVSELGENILTASSGADALRILLKHDVAVILLDVNMPIMDGFETATLIRQRKNLEHTPIIFITGINFNENYISKGYSLGAVDYICAPVVPDILKAKMAVFIELYRSREQVRKQGELLLDASERRAASLEWQLQELLNRLNLGVFNFNSEGKLIDANPAFLRLLGIGALQDVPPELLEHLSEFATLAGSTKTSLKTGCDIELAGVNGNPRWFFLNLTAAVDADGHRVLEGFLEDINDRKAAEEAVKESDHRKDRFLAILSHELRNPLAALHSAIRLGERSGEAEPWTREIISRQIRQLGKLTDDLLDIARINEDKVELQLEKTDLGELLARAVSVVKPALETQQHEFEQFVEPRLFINCDSTRVEQTVVNLLQNAAKYTPAGGKISLRAERSGLNVVVTVTDNGVGISEEMQKKIFDPFVQVDSSLDRSQGGLGIGLTLVKKLVDLHQGKVSVKSKGMGSGSEFSISLPALEKGESIDSEEASDNSERQGSGSIMLVDDNSDSAILMGELLRLSGYEVCIAHDGTSGIELATKVQPNAIFLDIGLPGMDGYEVARRLRAKPEFKTTLMIALSGYGQEKDIQLAREAGFDHHFVKPVDYNILNNLLFDSIGAKENGVPNSASSRVESGSQQLA